MKPTTAFLLLLSIMPLLQAEAQVYPHTDIDNLGQWVLNAAVSDEFEGTVVDEEKWLIQGRNGEYQSHWKGRAPSQFSTENVRVEDGLLKLQTRWEPDFDFSDKIDKDGRGYENITTAAVIAKEAFTYGYMEICCKCADASVTSAFWGTGNGQELDIFEHLGRPSIANKEHLETELWSSIHDWSIKGGPSVWTDRLQLPFRVASDFHTYACEWHADGLRFYADSILVREITREEVMNNPKAKEVGSEGWILTKPLYIWVDSETFPWHGLPSEKDLPVDYEIKYIRVWQKK